MNYQEALGKLETLCAGFKSHFVDRTATTPSFEDLCIQYGELEEVINTFAGIDRVEVKQTWTDRSTHPNFIAATLFSGYTTYAWQGYTQLLKVIGKVKQHAQDPSIPRAEYALSDVSQILRRFRECCQFLETPPKNEEDVKRIMWIVLRSHFERLDREETLSKFGLKSYRPDFGVPEIRLLIEAKFIGQKTDPKAIKDEILADIHGYLN